MAERPPRAELPLLPVAVRATAERRHGWWRRRRVVRWEVRFSDGRVVADRRLSRAIGESFHVSDTQPASGVAVASCPETGPGAWVGYPSGIVLDESS